MTVAPAPMVAPGPIVTPGRTREPRPTRVSGPTLTAPPRVAPGGDVGVFPDFTIVLDDGGRVDDGVGGDTGPRVNAGKWADEGPLPDPRAGGDETGGVDDDSGPLGVAGAGFMEAEAGEVAQNLPAGGDIAEGDDPLMVGDPPQIAQGPKMWWVRERVGGAEGEDRDAGRGVVVEETGEGDGGQGGGFGNHHGVAPAADQDQGVMLAKWGGNRHGNGEGDASRRGGEADGTGMEGPPTGVSRAG